MRRAAPKLHRMALLTVVAAAGACSSIEVTTPDVVFQVIEEVSFAASLEVDLTQMTRLDSGVYIQDKVVGEGAVAEIGTTPLVDYQGWLTNGALFDQGQFDFLMGSGQVIPGFEQGILGMKVGGTRLIIIPPGLAYGGNIVGSIPPGSILVFEVDLVSVT